MSNSIVRIAVVNILLAGIFVAVMTLQLGSASLAAMVLGGVALLINGSFLWGSRVERNSTRGIEVRDPPIGPGIASLRRSTGVAKAAKLPPESRQQREADPHELPPWLRVKDHIVMTWEGKHHVAPINGEDPFETAQRLHAQLRSGGQPQAAPRAEPDNRSN